MIDHMLVPLDGSALAECVLPHVVTIAKAFNSRVTVLQAIGHSPPSDSLQTFDPLEWHINMAKSEAYLNGVTARLQEAGLRAQNTIVKRQAAESIIEYAHDNDVELIVLSSHGRSGLSGWNVSSVVQKIILRSYRSILVVRAYQPVFSLLTGLSYQRLLVALDGSQRAECTLPLAANLSSYYGAQLMLVHVVCKPEMPRHEPPTQEDIQLVTRIMERNQQEAIRYLEQLHSRLFEDGLDLQTHLLVGESAATVLHDFIEREKIDMVLMAAHGYSGGGKQAYGGVTSSFIAYGTTPLTIMQDLELDDVVMTPAEIAARESKGH